MHSHTINMAFAMRQTTTKAGLYTVLLNKTVQSTRYHTISYAFASSLVKVEAEMEGGPLGDISSLLVVQYDVSVTELV